jgi:hypothetical protein
MSKRPSSCGSSLRARAAVAGLSVVSAVVLLGALPASAAEPVGLGTAGSFAVLAGAGITNTGPTTITGDVGTFPTTSESGFGSVTLNGANHAGDAVTQGAKNDLVTAYDDAAGRNPVTTIPTELGGSTLLGGVYDSTSGTFGLTGTLTLDARGDPATMFVFKTASTLVTATNSRVELLGGADPCHVVWQVGSSATFDVGSSFVGDVLALQSISALTSATFRGRLLARNGAVTLDTNTITNSTCATSAGGGGSTTSTTVTTATTVAPATTATTARATTATTVRASSRTSGGTSTTASRPPLAATGADHVAGPTQAAIALIGVGLLGVGYGRRRRGAHWR